MYNVSTYQQFLNSTTVYEFYFYVCSTLILPGTQQALLFTQQLTPHCSIYDSSLAAAQNHPFVSAKNVSFLTFFGKQRQRKRGMGA